jgi:EAL domain-containing protein (putative c-di-GMP-specific phosphodiesterase class I)
VVFELTDAEQVPRDLLMSAVRVFRAAGFGVSLDDHTATDDGLELVRACRPDAVKLSTDLLRRATRVRSAFEQLGGLVSAARSVGARVVAKGIESTDELAQAQRAGVELFQGFLLAHPRPSDG